MNTTMNRGSCFALIVATLLFGGCAKPEPQPIATNSTTMATEPAPKQQTVDAPIPLEIKSWDETQQWVASQKGKVVVLDLWSNW